MAKLLSTNVDYTLQVTGNTTVSGNIIVSGKTIIANIGNTVFAGVDGGTDAIIKFAKTLNFVNSNTVNVSVTTGSSGNANIALTKNTAGTPAVYTTLNNSPSTHITDGSFIFTSPLKELRLTPTRSIKITGLPFVSQADLYPMTIVNASTQWLIWLENEGLTSGATNRFKLPKGFPAFLMPGDSIELLYDTTISRWKVIEWANQGQAMGLTFFTDFTEDTGTQLTSLISGTGASVQTSTYLVDATEEPQGVLQIDTGTTALGRVQLGSSGNTQTRGAFGPALSVTRLASESGLPTLAENFRVRCGFEDSHGANTVRNGLYWELAPGGWSAYYANNNSRFSVTLDVTPTADAKYIWLIVYANPTWDIIDYLYSVDSANIANANTSNQTGFSTTTPGTSSNISWMAANIDKSAGTTQRNLSIDFAGYRYDTGTRG